MSTYIHSTCGQPQVFKFYQTRKPKDPSTTNIPLRDKNGKEVEIVIGGGAYVLSRQGGVTRKVTITEVTDEQLGLLHKCDSYLRMKERGFFTERAANHIEKDSKGNPSDMQIKDNTSQISDYDHAHGLDPRVEHAGTRATAGINNQEGGLQPDGSLNSDYGPIRL